MGNYNREKGIAGKWTVPYAYIMKNISILGSTGSIGTQTLEIVREQKDIRVWGLSAGKNIDLLEKQIREFHPKYASLEEESDAKALAVRVADTDTRVLSGMKGMLEISTMQEIEILVTAIVGMIGIRPTIAGICAGKDIALANKETLVTAGHLIMPLAKKAGVRILPVDSEHSAIFQCLNGEEKKTVEKILLTASGGPFFGKKKEELGNISLDDALKHPNWSMGKKVTIDSATMVNKGLEVMEAKWLFDVKLSQIQVVVHRQSIVHSMVEYQDGSIMAQLGIPDMKLPIQYALYYPDRRARSYGKADLFQIANLTFERPDPENFRGLALAFEAAKTGGSMPTVFNAANERAVAEFIEGKLKFLEIPEKIEHEMRTHSLISRPNLDEILEIEKEIKRK